MEIAHIIYWMEGWVSPRVILDTVVMMGNNRHPYRGTYTVLLVLKLIVIMTMSFCCLQYYSYFVIAFSCAGHNRGQSSRSHVSIMNITNIFTTRSQISAPCMCCTQLRVFTWLTNVLGTKPVASTNMAGS